jgi:hypothetical protein
VIDFNHPDAASEPMDWSSTGKKLIERLKKNYY